MEENNNKNHTEFDENSRLYLQFLQDNIARMNHNSVQIKTWYIGIISGLLALFFNTNNFSLILICIILIPLFCFIDTSYLWQEHKFVGIYNDFVKGTKGKPDVFQMPIKKYENGVKGFFKAFASWSVWPTYLIPLIIILILGYRCKC